MELEEHSFRLALAQLVEELEDFLAAPEVEPERALMSQRLVELGRLAQSLGRATVLLGQLSERMARLQEALPR